MRGVLLVVLAMLATLLGTSTSHADKRVALVVGNAAYRHIPVLFNPKNDAEDIGAALRQLGFETIVATDLDRAGMNDALGRFSLMVDGADIALIYYSGHGMQFAGSNYLLPTEARLDNAADVNRFRLMPVDDFLEALRPARGARVLVLDACRNNPVEDDLKRRMAALPGASRDALTTRGLSRTAINNGLLVAYSTQTNAVASDGTGRNSPFTSAFLKHMAAPDIDLRQMLFRVQDEVDGATGGKQRPELSISLVGEFKLAVRTPGVTVPSPSPLGPSASINIEHEFWSFIQSSENSDYFDEYLKIFPNGTFAAVARARVQDLKDKQRQRAESTELQERFSPPRVVTVNQWVQLWEKPTAEAKESGHIDPGGQVIVLGTVADGAWYRLSGTQFIPRNVLDDSAGNGASRGLGETPAAVRTSLASLERAAALFASDAVKRETDLKSIRYGAVSQKGNDFYFAWNEDSEEAAKKAASRNCTGSDCKVVATVGFKGCFALFRKGPAGFGWATRTDIAAAITSARETCVQKNKTCTKAVTFCADGSNVFKG